MIFFYLSLAPPLCPSTRCLSCCWLMYEPIVLSKPDERTKLPLVALLRAGAVLKPIVRWPLNICCCAVWSTMVGCVALSAERL